MAQGSYAEDQRTIALVQMLEQQHEQDASRLTGRPHRPIEHLVVASVVAVVAESHDTERRCHGTLAGSQYRADQQDLGFPPGRVAKQRGEGMEYGYNGIGQGEHGGTFLEKWGPASLPCSYNLSSFCAKSSFRSRVLAAYAAWETPVGWTRWIVAATLPRWLRGGRLDIFVRFSGAAASGAVGYCGFRSPFTFNRHLKEVDHGKVKSDDGESGVTDPVRWSETRWRQGFEG